MLQKIGICCSLFLAVFPVKNYAMDAEIINAASFTYVRNHRSAVETRDPAGAAMSSIYQMPLPPSDASYQFDDQYPYQTEEPMSSIYQMPLPPSDASYQFDDQYPYQTEEPMSSGDQMPLPPSDASYQFDDQYPYQVMPGYRLPQRVYMTAPLSPVYWLPVWVPYIPSLPVDQSPASVHDQISQNETYVFGDTMGENNKELVKRWVTSNGKFLNVHTLRNHLNNQGNDALKELGRLILIQNSVKKTHLIINYNYSANDSVRYLDDIMKDYKKDLKSSQEMNYLVDRIVKMDNGIMSKSISENGFNRSGVFNVSDDENLSKVIMNILQYLFSEKIKVNEIREGASGSTFNIDFTYQGAPIPGLKKEKGEFYLSKGTNENPNTSNLRIIASLGSNGYSSAESIRLADMYFYK